MYRRGARQSARVRAFIEFMVETFAISKPRASLSGQRKSTRTHSAMVPQPSAPLTRRAR